VVVVADVVVVTELGTTAAVAPKLGQGSAQDTTEAAAKTTTTELRTNGHHIPVTLSWPLVQHKRPA